MKTDKICLADIHTHILPNMDDGAESVEEAMRLLLAEKRQGVTDVVFTPHFVMHDNDVDAFIERRNTSFAILQDMIKESSMFDEMRFYLGAEVRYDPHLINIELDKLCIEGTSYLLLEPLGSNSFNFEQTVYTILSKGITPVLAHVERFDYLVRDKKFLSRLKADGVIFQCNASALSSKFYSSNLKKLLRNGFVHILASDAHNITRRPPMLSEGYEKLKKHREELMLNAENLINNRLI